jgi:hypothetical protein
MGPFAILQLVNKRNIKEKLPFLQNDVLMFIRNYLYLPDINFIVSLEVFVKSLKDSDPNIFSNSPGAPKKPDTTFGYNYTDIAISFLDSFIKKFKQYSLFNMGKLQELASHPGLFEIFEAAIRKGNKDIVKGLLTFLNIEQELLEKILKIAASNDQSEILNDIIILGNVSPEEMQQVFNAVVMDENHLNPLNIIHTLLKYKPQDQVWWNLSETNPKMKERVYQILFLAIKSNDKIMIDDLFSNRDIDINTDIIETLESKLDSKNALTVAAKAGHADVVKKILTKYKIIAKILNQALCEAILHAKEEIVIELLQYAESNNLIDEVLNMKGNIRLPDQVETDTPLNIALRSFHGGYARSHYKDKNIITILLEKINKINIENIRESFIIAAKYGDNDLVDKSLPLLLDDVGVLAEALKLSALYIHTEIVVKILNTRKIPASMIKAVFYDVLVGDQSQRVASNRINWPGYVAVIDVLLRFRPENEIWWNDMPVPENKVNRLKSTIDAHFLWAAQYGYFFIVNDLIVHTTIDVNLIHYETSPLSAATIGGHLAVVKLLIDTKKLSSDTIQNALSAGESSLEYYSDEQRENIVAACELLRTAAKQEITSTSRPLTPTFNNTRNGNDNNSNNSNYVCEMVFK